MRSTVAIDLQFFTLKNMHYINIPNALWQVGYFWQSACKREPNPKLSIWTIGKTADLAFNERVGRFPFQRLSKVNVKVGTIWHKEVSSSMNGASVCRPTIRP